MNEQELFSQLIEVLEVSGVTDSGKIKTSVGSVTAKKFYDMALEEDILIPKQYKDKVVKYLRNHLPEKSEVSTPYSSGHNAADSITMQLLAVRDYETSQGSYFNPTTNIIIKMKESVYNDKVSYFTGKPVSQVKAMYELGKLKFDPNSLEKKKVEFSKSWGADISIYNTWAPPEWRYDTELEAEMPEDIAEFLDHLVENERTLDSLLVFSKHLMEDRNHAMLTLLGSKGIGKGILVDNIMAQLVGLDYYQKVGTAILDKDFNNQFFQNQLLFLDEVDPKVVKESAN